ncbi:hypothetical protein HNR60_003457 [Rhodopseudomonas rhenobacensis]|uniref:Uncharacterized protein n=1 Tax=Rhodopseudomonas rhenobacensis TaxID=87461 RepID=A0A7W7Z652_9BRAD|nr:hypothetical protein [Rhodopseudomonas rhenobacensis]
MAHAPATTSLGNDKKMSSTLRLPANLPVRFCVGRRDGLTSHSWRVWSERRSEIYLACRDAFQDIKVSLHSSGRWRMGFTKEAIEADPTLIAKGRNRAWDVWDKPDPQLPNVVVAFGLYFPQSEFLVTPEQRTARSWKEVRYIPPACTGRVNIVSLCIAGQGVPFDPDIVHLGRFELPQNRWAHVIAHETDAADIVRKTRHIRTRLKNESERRGRALPADSFGYFLARANDGRRSLLGLRVVAEDDSQ